MLPYKTGNSGSADSRKIPLARALPAVPEARKRQPLVRTRALAERSGSAVRKRCFDRQSTFVSYVCDEGAVIVSVPGFAPRTWNRDPCTPLCNRSEVLSIPEAAFRCQREHADARRSPLRYGNSIFTTP